MSATSWVHSRVTLGVTRQDMSSQVSRALVPPRFITLRPKGRLRTSLLGFKTNSKHTHILARPTPASFEAQRPKELGLVEVELLADGEGASPMGRPRVVGTFEEADAPLSIRWADRRGVPS